MSGTRFTFWFTFWAETDGSNQAAFMAAAADRVAIFMTRVQNENLCCGVAACRQKSVTPRNRVIGSSH